MFSINTENLLFKTFCVSDDMLVTQLCPTLCDPRDRAMEFSRKEYWSGYPFPSPGNLPNPGIKPRSPALWPDSLLSEPQRKPH